MAMNTLLYGCVVGIALGLTGGGGSIFAVPLLLYAVGLPLREAVTVSLAVVGLTALYGALFQYRQVRWGPGVIFGIGGILGAPAGAWIGSRLPERGMLLLFAGLMMGIGLRMLRTPSAEAACSPFTCRRTPAGEMEFRWPCALKLLGFGGLTGLLSGAFGVGGGFLIVPALLLVTAMPMAQALATSLVCITLVSASGFVANVLALGHFAYGLAGLFLAGGALGMTAGALWKNRLSPTLLRRVFAIFVLAVATWIAARTLSGNELPGKTHPRVDQAAPSAPRSGS